MCCLQPHCLIEDTLSVSLAWARNAWALCPAYSQLCTPVLPAPCPFSAAQLPITCHLYSNSALPTRHLSSQLLPSLPGGGGTVYPKKLLCKEGPVATVPIRWGRVRAQTSLLPWLPCSPQSPGTPTQTFPAHGAWPACSTLPAQGSWPGAAGCRQGKEAAVKGCIGGNRDRGQRPRR